MILTITLLSISLLIVMYLGINDHIDDNKYETKYEKWYNKKE